MKAYVFPGQGSQKRGMGEDLFDEFPDYLKIADDILGYSIKELCLNNPNQLLNTTKYTQPALFTINALSYYKYLSETKESEPDFFAGHSLGEYNALLAAGAFGFSDGLKIVKKRAELMSKATNGGMAAIAGLDQETISKIAQSNSLYSIEIANINSYSQIVISGFREEIEKIMPLLNSEGAVFCIVLPVSGAFHSSQMSGFKSEFIEYLREFKFCKLNKPVISNVTACPYTDEDIHGLLSSQLDTTVNWLGTVKYLLKRGVDDFKEIGPGAVLKNLIRSIINES
ncbi:ACP S-malonyltransferase [Paenibacillus motobuensis]|uniref:Malonyl CoA-acyl carrier protein transacylase n=1 Tax=Paenibacillus motobuensis TaxID=295324 RepID=A0ABN0XXX2_9BACL